MDLDPGVKIVLNILQKSTRNEKTFGSLHKEHGFAPCRERRNKLVKKIPFNYKEILRRIAARRVLDCFFFTIFFVSNAVLSLELFLHHI
jgi:hypothetical protein